jgi:hypothetical protein
MSNTFKQPQNTNSMKLNPSWEADNWAPTQEFDSILRNLKVNFRINNSPTPVHILSQINPIDITSSYLS